MSGALVRGRACGHLSTVPSCGVIPKPRVFTSGARFFSECKFFSLERCRRTSLFLGLRTQFGSVVGLIVMKHAPGGVQQLAHDGDQGLQFGLAACD